MIGEISALGCALCWAASSTLTKSLAGKFEPLNLNLLRCAAASILLWGIIPFTPGTEALAQAPGASLFFLALSALIGIALGDTLYIRGLRLINVTLAFPMAQSAMPLFTLAAAILFLGEKVTWSLFLGTVLILGGIYLITKPGRRRHHPQTNLPAEKRRKGISLVICASLLWAISISLLKLGLQGVSLILANGVRLPLAALVLLFFIFWQKSPSQPTTPKFKDVALGAITGLLGFGLGGILFLQAILYSGAAKTTVLTTSAPLFGLPLSLIILKERVTGRVVAGTVLGVLGIGFIV